MISNWPSPLTASAVGLGTKPFNQWTSAYLYGTDILLATIFILWLVRTFNYWSLASIISKLSSNNWRRESFWLAIFLIISTISIFNSRIVGLSLYQLLKLAEFIGLYFYLKANLSKVFSFQGVLGIIIASGLFQSVVAIIQYIKQSSLGLRLLGESPLSVHATGVAIFIADGVRYLRTYGTTPHPNILAAWLFVAIFAFYFWYIYHRTSQDRWSCDVPKLAIYAVLLFGLFFTFSRVIIGLWVLGVLARLLIVVARKEFRENTAIRRKVVQLSAVSLIVVLIFSAFFWPQVKSRVHISAQEEAVTQRAYYNKIAGSVAASHPFLGMGIGQFVPNMMSKLKHLPANAYQPVHNIYLLIASETGFPGLVIFLGFIVAAFWGFARRTRFTKLYHFSFFILAGSFLIIGLFDHFIWTSQQGSIIFWMMLALMAAPLKSVSPSA